MTSYFFDTYALIEMAKGNPSYSPYTKSSIITSVVNLLEFHYRATRNFGLEPANRLLHELSRCVIAFTNEDIIAMTRFRMSNKKKNFSFPDSLGYVISVRKNIKFLTGDEGFRSMPNVEFIK